MTKRQKYFKAYKKKNAKKIKEYEAERYKKNRTRILARNNKWNAENRKRVAEISRQWDINNRERRAANGVRWRKENPDKDKAIWHRRQAKKREAGGSFTAQEWTELKRKYGFRCLCCNRRLPLEADHVIPVAHGGTSFISNIQPLCRSCNAKKSSKHTDFRKGKHGQRKKRAT